MQALLDAKLLAVPQKPALHAALDEEVPRSSEECGEDASNEDENGNKTLSDMEWSSDEEIGEEVSQSNVGDGTEVENTWLNKVSRTAQK